VEGNAGTTKQNKKNSNGPLLTWQKKILPPPHHHSPAGGSEDPEAAFDAAVARQNAHLETALSRAEVRFFFVFLRCRNMREENPNIEMANRTR
jgi:hypothetical protein